MTNIINLQEAREQRQPPSPEEVLEKTGMDYISLEFMEELITILRSYNIDPQHPETAENMIFLSMLFQSHIDRINGKDNDFYEFFNDMRSHMND